MADRKVVRGTLGGVTVETTQENADRLSGFEAANSKSTASKSSSSKSSK